jgi:hypothetical protein
MPGATPDLQRPFDCPICGSNEYHGVVFQSRKGGDYHASLYECGGCHVVFGDVEKFTRVIRSTWSKQFTNREVKATRETLAYPEPWNSAAWMEKPKR